MRSIQLKAFQEDAILALVKEIQEQLHSMSLSLPRLVFQAPTGSGKTVMAGEVLDQLFSLNPDLVVLWVSIGNGKLHHQSKEKLRKQLPSDISVLSAEESLLGGRMVLAGKTIVTISWQEINTKKGDAWTNVIMRDGEKLNFRQLVQQTRRDHPILLLIDEAHTTAKSNRSKEIIQTFNPQLVLEMTATPDYPSFKKDETLETWVSFSEKSLSYRGYRVDAKRVSEEGLICKRLMVNDGIEGDASKTSVELIIETSYLKYLEVKKGYQAHGITPLLLIQIPDSEAGDLLRQRVEDYFKTYGITTQNHRLNIWLSEEHLLSEDLTCLNSPVEVLIFKQAINTGWDCPRAKVLVQFRNVKKEETELQTVGRILRMPEQHHYADDLLNTAFVYTDLPKPTLDEDVKQLGVFKDLTSSRVIEDPIRLTSYYHSHKTYNYLVFNDLLVALKRGLGRHFKLDFDSPASSRMNLNHLSINQTPLHEDLKMGGLMKGKLAVGESTLTHYDVVQVLKDKDQVTMECRAFLKPYLKAFGQEDFETNYQTLMSALHLLFTQFVTPTISPSLLQLHLVSYRESWELCLKEVIETYRIQHEAEATYQAFEYDWRLPSQLHFSSDEVETNLLLQRYAYAPAYLFKNRSLPEKTLESVLETHPEVAWWYKNGDAGRDHLGIGYLTADGVQRTFYPDYLIKTIDGTLWVYETKGYGTANLDEHIEEKARALRRFIERHQQSGIDIKGAILAPNGTFWYQYQIGTGEMYNSPHCWQRVVLFSKDN